MDERFERFERFWFTLGSVGIIVLLTMIFACAKPKPKPVPQPTPIPAPGRTIEFPNLLLRQEGGHLTRGAAGGTTPFRMSQAIACWDPEEINHYGWGGFTQPWIDYTRPFGVNTYYIRLGPSKNFDQWENGLNFQHSPYLNNDPAQGFDPVWWKRATDMCRAAGRADSNCQVDLIDAWICKHAVWGDFESPWSAADVRACTHHITTVQEAFVRKAVQEFGCLANVFWQDGNEPGVSGWYDPQWSLQIRDIVRDEEQKVDCGGGAHVVHMFGTNSGHPVVEDDPGIDYTITHSNAGISGPVAGKFRMNNEHNPPFPPQQERELFCAAGNAGQAWAYWRGGHSQADMDATLALFSEPCPEMPSGECPFDVPRVATIKVKCGPAGAVEECDSTPLVQGAAYCRSIGYTDGRSACPLRPEGAPFRIECELKSMGGLHEFRLANVSGDIHIRRVFGNGFKIALEGTGSAEVQVFAPARPGEDLAVDGQGTTPVRVVR